MDFTSLSGKVIVITGASSGFGKGAARAFAGHGALLALSARRQNLLDELAFDCETRGGRAIAHAADVSKSDQVESLARHAVDTYGGIDVWINDAGVGAIGRFDEIPLEDHVQVVETNLLGTMYGGYFALRQFRKQGHGVLINLSSVLGKIPAPYYASYTASKHAIVGLDAALRQELLESKEDRIKVCTILPMAMDTPFFDHAANYTGHQSMPIPPLYDPQKVIDTIVRFAIEPRDELIVGPIGKLHSALHSVAPRLVERMMSHQTHKTQIEDAPLEEPTGGSVRSPQPVGKNVRAGRLKENKRSNIWQEAV
jgi:short-subunit dehydrogenase